MAEQKVVEADAVGPEVAGKGEAVVAVHGPVFVGKLDDFWGAVVRGAVRDAEHLHVCVLNLVPPSQDTGVGYLPEVEVRRIKLPQEQEEHLLREY